MVVLPVVGGVMVATWTATIGGGINVSPLALIVFSGHVC